MTYLDIADDMGFEYSNHEGYCGSIFWGQGEKELGVVTHLDVVTSGNGWSFDPFAGIVKGDFIVGRGTQDNKGAAIGALYVLKYFKDHNINLDKRLHLIAGCNEESGMEGIKYFLRNENAPDFSLITDCGFPVCYGEKGHIEVSLEFSIKKGQIISLNGGTTANSVADFCEIEVNCGALSEKQSGLVALDIIEKSDSTKISITSKGKSAHASTPNNGDNAIAKLLNYLVDKFEINDVSNEVIYKIRDIVNDDIGKVFGIECKDEESGSLSVSAGIIRLNDHIIELVLDIRYPVTFDGSEIVENCHLCVRV
jgi:succinyl-diaminopimelate desuccinylase